MAASFPPTPINLLSQLKSGEGTHGWQVSWRRFLELYHEPLAAAAQACYRHHTNGLTATQECVEDAVANTLADFFSRSRHRYDATKGRFRTYLRVLVNARVVDILRKDRPLDRRSLDSHEFASAPPESPDEHSAFQRSLLATLIEDLRNQVAHRQFEIFERVKLKGEAPETLAKELGVRRAVIDRNVYKVMCKLREIARLPEYQEEFFA